MLAFAASGRSLSGSALIATVVDARQLKNGRQFAAYLALVLKEASSGGQRRLSPNIGSRATNFRARSCGEARASRRRPLADKTIDRRAGSFSYKQGWAGIERWCPLNKRAHILCGRFGPRGSTSIRRMSGVAPALR